MSQLNKNRCELCKIKRTLKQLTKSLRFIFNVFYRSCTRISFCQWGSNIQLSQFIVESVPLYILIVVELYLFGWSESGCRSVCRHFRSGWVDHIVGGGWHNEGGWSNPTFHPKPKRTNGPCWPISADDGILFDHMDPINWPMYCLAAKLKPVAFY